MLRTLYQRIDIMKNNVRYHNVFPEMCWEEKAAIQLYTEQTHIDINNYLRNIGEISGDDENVVKRHISHISSGLAKSASKYQKPSFRGMAFTQEMLNDFEYAYQNGKGLKFNAFTSASKDRHWAFSFAEKYAYEPGTSIVIMKINSAEGIDISSLSVYPEREILFKIGLTFHIDLIEETEGSYFINVNEV